MIRSLPVRNAEAFPGCGCLEYMLAMIFYYWSLMPKLEKLMVDSLELFGIRTYLGTFGKLQPVIAE